MWSCLVEYFAAKEGAGPSPMHIARMECWCWGVRLGPSPMLHDRVRSCLCTLIIMIARSWVSGFLYSSCWLGLGCRGIFKECR